MPQELSPGQLFKDFSRAYNFTEIKNKFLDLCRNVSVDPGDNTHVFQNLQLKLSRDESRGLWTLLKKRAQQDVYMEGKACQGKKVCTLSTHFISLI